MTISAQVRYFFRDDSAGPKGSVEKLSDVGGFFLGGRFRPGVKKSGSEEFLDFFCSKYIHIYNL